MAKGTQIIQFLRNGAPIQTVGLEAAKTVINGQLSSPKFLDGSPILARYKEAADSVDFKTLLGVKHEVGGVSGVTFYTDDATIESMIQSYVGTGVTTANTVTSQLEALRGDDSSVSGDTSVEGAKRYADELVDVEETAREDADEALSGAIDGLSDVVDGDRVTGGTAISASSGASGTSVNVQVDDSTIKVNGNNQLYVASTGLTPYTGSSAITVTQATGSETANTISLTIDSTDQVLSQSANGLRSDMGLQITTGTGALAGKTVINLYGKGGSGDVISSVDATDFVKDGFLSSVTYDDESQVLTFVWNTDAGVETTEIAMSGLVDTYEAGSGVTKVTTGVDHPTFTGVVDNTSEAVTTGKNASGNVLTVGANGFKVSNIQSAIDYKHGIATALTQTVSGNLMHEIASAETRAKEYASGQDETLKSELEGKIASATSVVTGSTYIEVTASEPAASGITYTVAASGLATSAELTTEATTRSTDDANIHNIMGQQESTYTKNTGATYISGAVSMNDADVKLDTAIAALSGTVTGLTNDYVSGVTFNGTAATVTNHVAAIDAGASDIKMRGYTAGGTGDVDTGDTVNQAISKLETKADNNASAITAETSARETADEELKAKINSAKTTVAEDSDFLSVATSATENGVTYTISTSGIASASDLQTVSGNLETVSGNLDTVSGKANTNAAKIASATTGYTAGTDQFATAVTQSDGKITAVGFAQPNASGVTFESGSIISSSTVQDAIEEVYNKSVSGLKVVVSALTTPNSGYLKTYDVLQGGQSVGQIDIPKDLVVTSGSVEVGTWNGNTFTPDPQGTGHALKLVIANQDDPVYINVADLADAYSGITGTTVAVRVSDYEISAEVINESIDATKLASGAVTTAKIADSAVATAKIADSAVTSAKLATEVQNAINASVTGVDDSDTIDMTLTGRVISADVKASSISASHLANSAVNEDKIAGSAVTSGKIADNAVTTDKIVNGNVTSAKLSTELQSKIQSALTNINVNGVAGTVNSSIASVTLSGNNINLGSDYATQVADDDVAGAPATSDTVNQALAKLYKSISANEIVNGDTTTVSTTQGKSKVEVNVDKESIVKATTNGSTVLAVGTVDCGEY